MADLKELKINGKEIYDLLYPIGSIYQTVNADFDPNSLFSGTWTRVKGKVLVGVDEQDSDFEVSRYSSGEKTHKLTVNELPAHNHSVTDTQGRVLGLWATNAQAGSLWQLLSYGVSGTNLPTATTQNKGGGVAHNNMPPYYTVYIWERTA